MPRRALLWAAAGVLSVSVVIGLLGRFSPRVLPHGFNSPGLVLQFAEASSDVIGSVGNADDSDRRVMRRQVHIDWFLIAAYLGFFVAASRQMRQAGRAAAVRALAFIPAVLGAGAAMFDARENLALYDMLNGAAPLAAPLARWKWTLFFAAITSAAPVIWPASALGRATGVLLAASGVSGLLILYLQRPYPVWLDKPVALFGIALVIVLVIRVIDRGVAWVGRRIQALDAWLRFKDLHLNRTDGRATGVCRHSPGVTWLPAILVLFLVNGPALRPTARLGVALVAAAASWFLFRAVLARAAAWKVSHRNDLALQGALLIIVGAVVWLLAVSTATERGGALLYQHVLIPVVALTVIAVVAGAFTGSDFLTPTAQPALADRLKHVELFVSLPPQQPVTGAMVMVAAGRVLASTPGRLLFPPALASLLVWHEFVKPLFVVVLVLDLIVLAFANINARFSASWNWLHRIFFGGWAALVSTAVIVLGIARVLDVQYVSTVFDGAKSYTIGGYLLFAYTIAWWYDYWSASGIAARLLACLGTPTAQGAQLAYDYEGPPQTSVPTADRRIQLHGAGRLLVLKDAPGQKFPYFHSYGPAELIESLADDLPPKDPLRPALDSLRWRVDSDSLRTAAIFVCLLVGTGFFLRTLHQHPLLTGTTPGPTLAAGHVLAPACDAGAPLIAVAASGGGTRAALYTTSVLERLHRAGLLASVRLVSGVSGGGAALAYFAAHRPSLLKAQPGDASWNAFYDAMQASYIEDVIDGSGEWRIATGHRLGHLLAESFDRAWDRAGTRRVTLGEVADVGIILNSAVAGRVERDGRRRSLSDVSGGRVIFTNIDLPDHFGDTNPVLFDGGGPSRDARLPVFVVRDGSVRLSQAAAANANFPPVFSNIPVEHPDARIWATDGGAIDNRGLETLLMTLRRELAARPECAARTPLHVIEVEASGYSDSYSQDRGVGSALSAGAAFASQLDAELLDRMRKEFQATAVLHYLPMPLLFRRAGAFGTHWMMQNRIPVCLQEPCGRPLVLDGADVITVLRNIDSDQLQGASDNATTVHKLLRSAGDATTTQQRESTWQSFVRCVRDHGGRCGLG